MIRLISSFFYIGYLPIASGTYASIAGVLLFFFLRGNSFYLGAVTGLIVVLGFMTCGRAEKIFKVKDSSKIVIDEVSGMLICCCFIPHTHTFFYTLLVFSLFRVFDILKPFPINKIQDLKGSLGVMLDDILAAFYALALIYLIDYIRIILT